MHDLWVIYRGTSTDTPTGGTGLGMAIVKQIVTAHQGRVEVKSKVGNGTSVIVRLLLNESIAIN
ncbi:ATP-binding protein [Desulfosporosinus fructosivorans]